MKFYRLNFSYLPDETRYSLSCPEIFLQNEQYKTVVRQGIILWERNIRMV
jgi:hypothetical protein